MHVRPSLPTFDYVRAETPSDAIDLLQKHGKATRLLMGGTDLFVRLRQGDARPQVVVDVKHVPGMQAIAFDWRDGLTVGAAVNLNKLARHPDVLANYPLLAEAAESVASYQLRQRATLGGNLCNGSPAADTAPAVLVLGGRLVLQSPAGRRQVPASQFFLGPGQTVIEADELLTAVRFPLAPPGAAGTYLKLGRNKAGDLAIVGVAVLGFQDEAAGSGYGFRIGLASVAPTPMRAWAAESFLARNRPGEETFILAADMARDAATPIDDVRASAIYRRAMVRNLTLRGLRDVWARLHGEAARTPINQGSDHVHA